MQSIFLFIFIKLSKAHKDTEYIKTFKEVEGREVMVTKGS